MMQHDRSQNESGMSKMAAEHHRVTPPHIPDAGAAQGVFDAAARERSSTSVRPSGLETGRRQGYYADPGGWVGAMVAARPVGWDVRSGEVLAMFKDTVPTERGQSPRGQQRWPHGQSWQAAVP